MIKALMGGQFLALVSHGMSCHRSQSQILPLSLSATKQRARELSLVTGTSRHKKEAGTDDCSKA